MQAISAAEEEAAKKKVGSAAALRQLEKLRKEAARTSKEAEKTADDLASRKGEHKVRNRTSVHLEEGIVGPMCTSLKLTVLESLERCKVVS